MARELSSNKLEWAVTQAFGSCLHCNMDLTLLSTPSGPQVSGRASNDRRGARSGSSEPIDMTSGDAAERQVLASMASAKLDPFRPTDLPRGVYTDGSDPLGRVWYHIPNLGAKFCDAVRKYSVVANFREAHVIARKRSKESECMWVGIVGDPSEYTTGSKRHIIEFMCRNPGIALDQSASRRNQARIRANKCLNPLKKRRRKRRRSLFPVLKVDSGGLPESVEEGGVSLEDTPSPTDIVSEESSSEYDNDEVSSHSSTTPSMMAMERQVSGQYGFGLRETAGSPMPPPTAVGLTSADSKIKLSGLPPATALITTEKNGDWLDLIHGGSYLYMLREPPMPSPGAGKMFTLLKPAEPPSPEVKVIRKYSVEDLNQLLINSELDVI